MKPTRLTLALLAGFTLSGAAQATLIDRGGGMIYDDVLDITWLQDANYAENSGYHGYYGDGRMNWYEAQDWAANLSYGGYDDWRLPTMLDTGIPGCDYANSGTDCGYNVQTYDAGTGTVYSELAYMYYVNLGLKSVYSPTGDYQPDWGLFGNGTRGDQNDVGLVKNLRSSYGYWFGTEYAPDPAPYVWSFGFYQGGQSYGDKGSLPMYAWAVRPGDVAAPVPEPETYALLLAGLGLVGVAARRRRG